MSGGTTLTATNVTSTRPDGAYVAGDVIDIVVTLPSANTWTVQRPTISMHTQQASQGDSTIVGEAVFVDGNGTSTWRFEYRIKAGVNITDLSTAAAINRLSGTWTRVSDSASITAINLPAATTRLSDNKAITANTTAVATITATSVTIDVAAGTYTPLYTFNFTVTFPEAITRMLTESSSESTLRLTDSGGTDKFQAIYVSGSGTNTWRFTGTLGAGLTVSGLRCATAIGEATSLKRIGFLKADGTPCQIALPAHGAGGAFSTTKTIDISGTANTLSVPTSTIDIATGDYNAGQACTITVTFSGSVTNGSGSNISLLMGDHSSGNPIGEATYVSGSGTSVWTFAFTIPAGFSITALGIIRFLMNDNSLRSTIAISGTSNFSKTITATTKAVSTDTTCALGNGSYGAGVNVDIVVTLPFAVSLTGGTPTLALADADGSSLGVSAAYLSGSGTTSWTFRYTTQPGIDATELRTGAFAANGATLTKTSGGSAVTVEIHDEWIGSLIANKDLALTGLGTQPWTRSFFSLQH